MVKRKKKKKQVVELLELGLTTGVGAGAISALPSSPEITPIKTSVTGGLAKFSTAFRPAFSLAGTTMVLKQTSSLVKATKKLRKKKRRRRQ